ncbi:iron-siderophore ABC transporter substrate-binding protein [Rhodococcus artemisiae]|uniref:Iron-siderophore ABC transporter substrate-binding protein n=1 Tax=Rhodococcus artemisiae TaxID=714159 RepID=A0ABU7L813_9NOCA|nr:iron-siderophore ABC transporter substrate-binding protein [Rhodococcus artemisiae]MEE2057678.1 iron-siderophore ABC transporter substrate-binding protein [Rhodococcus artemisiae]
MGALVIAANVTACSSDGSEDTTASAGGDAAFPVSIEHVHGTTTITEKPERIVTLGVTDADVVLALGVAPVGNTGYTFYETGLGPWTEELVGDAELTRIDSDSEPNLEQIAGLVPDLIIGISAGYDEAVYDKLSEIAPTVSRPDGFAAYTVDREVATETIATALGESERGAELNLQTADRITATVETHPEFAGKTGVAVLPYDNQYGAFLPGDARGAFLTSLGFRIPDAITSQDTGDSFFVGVSKENVSMLDGDLILVLGDDQTTDIAADNPLVENLNAAQNDAIIATTLDQRGAITYNSVLSIPYAIDSLVPRLSDALA